MGTQNPEDLGAPTGIGGGWGQESTFERPAVLNCLGQILDAEMSLGLQVSHGSGDSQHALVAAR